MSFRAVAAIPAEDWTRHTVAELMQPLEEVMQVAPDDPLSDVVTNLAQAKLNRALVCADGTVVGLLSITDVTRTVELRSFETGGGRPAERHPNSGIAPLSARPRGT
jgi:signal-transduction protein with cAMP-binding, CBS, and nucleotidyltransferase domain